MAFSRFIQVPFYSARFIFFSGWYRNPVLFVPFYFPVLFFPSLLTVSIYWILAEVLVGAVRTCM